MNELPLTLEKQYSVLLPPTLVIHILLVGVGGTGSWLALSLGRLAYHARQKGITFHLTFVDPDRVEIKNVGRQACKLFGISQGHLHHWAQIQHGGDRTNDYSRRLVQIPPRRGSEACQSLAQLRDVPGPGRQYH